MSIPLQLLVHAPTHMCSSAHAFSSTRGYLHTGNWGCVRGGGRGGQVGGGCG